MSDFKILSNVLMILAIIVTLLLEIIESTNTKNRLPFQITGLSIKRTFRIRLLFLMNTDY